MLKIEYDGNIFTVADIDNLPNLYRIVDPISYNLEYDVFTFKVKSDAVGEQKLRERFGFWLATASNEGIVINNGDFADFVYGRHVKIYEDDVLKAVMYATDVSPVNQRDQGEELFQVQCVSSIGILSRVEHYGGVYVGATAGSIIAEIMDGLPYTIDSGLAAEPLYGWLPYVKDARKNLNKVLFATGAMISRNENGNVHFTYQLQDVAKNIPKSRTFYGGIISQKEHKSAITVIEHGFYQSQEAQEELIFDNTQGVAGDNTRVTFNEPYYDYRGDGITVVSSSANYAIITGVGYLYAKKYVHTQRPVSEIIDNIGEPETLQVSDQTLVSSLNVNGIVERMANYYGNAKIRTFDIEVSNEKPGDLIEFYDRRDHVNTGYIKSIDESASSFWRGTINAVTGWTPTKSGNDFTRYKIVTGADLAGGVWTVPAEMRGQRARVVLFSGAEGGQGGYAGESKGMTRAPWTYTTLHSTSSRATRIGALEPYPQTGGQGGAGGKGGASATRFINIDVDALSDTYAVQFGAGGAGGAGGTVSRSDEYKTTVTEPQPGSPGGDSVFSGTSTASGAIFRGTYVNLITGEVLAQVGADGVAGGNGGQGGYSERWHGAYPSREEAQAYDYSQNALAKGANGDSVSGYAGGAGAVGANGFVVNAYNYGLPTTDGVWYHFCGAGGGGGGGAAMGSAGGAGDLGYGSSAGFTDRDVRVSFYYVNQTQEDPDEDVTLRGAKGGDGADATVIPTKPLYVGGTGGHGGGGGGGAGQCIGWEHASSSSGYDTYYGEMYGGKGGNGGKGGDGSDGFMIVYW